MPLYVSDWLGDPNVQMMSLEEQGAYLRLLCGMWQLGGYLPNDDLRIARLLCVSIEKWQELKTSLSHVIHTSDDGAYLYNDRLLREIERMTSKRSQAQRAAQMRWSKDQAPPLAGDHGGSVAYADASTAHTQPHMRPHMQTHTQAHMRTDMRADMPEHMQTQCHQIPDTRYQIPEETYVFDSREDMSKDTTVYDQSPQSTPPPSLAPNGASRDIPPHEGHLSPGEGAEGVDGGLGAGGGDEGEPTASHADTASTTEHKAAPPGGNIRPRRTRRTHRSPGGYPEAFESAWAAYPRHVEKSTAFAAWQARVRAGADPDELRRAAENYAAYCAAEGREQRYIKHAATFWGPKEPWREWLVPEASPDPPKRPMHSRANLEYENTMRKIDRLFGDDGGDVHDTS